MTAQNILKQKQAIVDHIQDVAQNSQSMIAVHYRGMTVSEMVDIRNESRSKGVYLKVVKNTLARRALSQSQYAGATDKIVGPVLLCFASEEPNTAAKLIKDYMVKIKCLKVQVIAVENQVLAPESIEQVAKMPNKHQALALLMGGMQAPITGLACALKETYAKLVRTLSEVARKRG